MPETVAIPTWVLVFAWSAVGYRLAVRGQNALLVADVGGGSKAAKWILRRRFSVQVAITLTAALLAGPFVWVSVAQEAGRELVAWIVRTVSRRDHDA